MAGDWRLCSQSSRYPEHWPGSDWLAPDAWAQMPEYIPAPWPQMSPERFWPNYNQSMNPNYDNQYMKPQEDYNQGMNPQEAKELGFGEVLDKSWGLQHCPKAAGPIRMPVKKSTPPLLQPPPPPPPPSRPPPLPQPPLSLTPPARRSTPPRSQKRKAGRLTGRRKQCNPLSAPPSPPSPISVSSHNSAPARSPRKKNNLDGRPPAPPEALSPVPSVHSIDYDGSPTSMPVPTEIPTPVEETVCKTPLVGIRENSPGSHASKCSSISDTDSESGGSKEDWETTPECPNNHAGNESDGTETESASPTVATVPCKYSPTEYSPATDSSSADSSSAEVSSAEVSSAKVSIANYAAKVILPTTEKNEG